MPPQADRPRGRSGLSRLEARSAETARRLEIVEITVNAKVPRRGDHHQPHVAQSGDGRAVSVLDAVRGLAFGDAHVALRGIEEASDPRKRRPLRRSRPRENRGGDGHSPGEHVREPCSEGEPMTETRREINRLRQGRSAKAEVVADAKRKVTAEARSSRRRVRRTVAAMIHIGEGRRDKFEELVASRRSASGSRSGPEVSTSNPAATNRIPGGGIGAKLTFKTSGREREASDGRAWTLTR